jgi:glycosyltransferase involved in cell wall biosynthesis
VPSLEVDGGVASVAEFVCETIERSGRYDLALVSLPSAARHPLSVAFTRPASWLRGVRSESGVWRGRPFVAVGAAGSELEFQRYQPRSALARALAGCDLIQVVTGLPAPAYAVCGLGKPVAVHCATRASIERRARHQARGGPAEMGRRVMTRLIDRIDRRALERADAIQVMNPWMLDYARGINAGRHKSIRLVQPGVDTSRFVPCPARRRQAAPYVLCVGRLHDARKNTGLLLQAYAALAASLDAPVQLVLAGFYPPGDEFWREVDRLDLRARVSFVPSPDPAALVALYQAATVFALSSDEEGFGMVVLEAMACGVPVVSTASGGPDAIIRNGVDGFLVPVGDAVALRDRLARLVTDSAFNRRMGEAARAAVVERFDARRAGDILLETYDQLL